MTEMARSIPSDLIQIFKASYSSVLPQELIRKKFNYNKINDALSIMGYKIPLHKKKVFMVGAGKGAQFMAREIFTLMGPRIEKGIISIPEGSLDRHTKSDTIDYREGAKDNLPDAKAEVTAKLIKELAESLSPNDLLLVLLTGGGSALMPLPKEPITLDEKTQLIKILANSGANINELNIVRKRLSDIKGGKLAMCTDATVVTLIISDIVNNPLDLIASGPTVENTDDPKVAIDILNKYKLYDALPNTIKSVLEKNLQEGKTFPSVQNFVHDFEEIAEEILKDEASGNDATETQAPSSEPSDAQISIAEDKDYPTEKVLNFLIGSNETAVRKAYDELMALDGYVPIIVSQQVTGDVKSVAKEYFKLVQIIGEYFRERNVSIEFLEAVLKTVNIPGMKKDFESLENLRDITAQDKIVCLILAGETTVEVVGTGKGGRNQQLALEFSRLLYENKILGHLSHINAFLLSAGTDGIDGPTDAAGAIADKNVYTESFRDYIDADKYLFNNDCYTFYKNFRNGRYHVKTGHTHTNVMDIHLLAIEKSSKSELNLTIADFRALAKLGKPEDEGCISCLPKFKFGR